jgi:para-nitrobenzyl esterase
MSMTWTGWRACTRLAVAGVTLGGLVAVAPAVGASTLGGQAAAGASGPVAGTANGAVRGLASGAVDEFLGIPYAAPPVGALRWQPPQPAASWSGVRDATQFAPHCPQAASPFGQASTSEDCLFLNVFTPSHQRAGSPVMVWIHGGALVTGESDDYNPAKLVEDGVTVVTINYRLGALGFLAHPALADANGQSGDYGLMDQQAALRWVQRNIASFGGNPHNVTIFGESAGGLSTLSQVASPQARGLFERAIVESGSYNLTQASLASAETAGEAFATKAGCASQTAACLRGLPVSTILADEDAAGCTPNINSEVLPQTLGTAFATGNFNRVPIINGTNRDEWRLFVAISELEGNPVTASNYQSMISSTLGVPAAAAAVIAAKYPLTAFSSPSVALGAVGTDAIFACPALTIDQSVSHFVPTFAYEFNDENAPENFLPPVSFPYGAPHASEIQYLMDLPAAAFPGTLSAQQQQLATIMKGYWTNFAKRGFPSSFGTLSWPLFNNVTQKMQSLVPPTPQTETDFATTHNCGFWTALAAAA